MGPTPCEGVLYDCCTLGVQQSLPKTKYHLPLSHGTRWVGKVHYLAPCYQFGSAANVTYFFSRGLTHAQFMKMKAGHHQGCMFGWMIS